MRRESDRAEQRAEGLLQALGMIFTRPSADDSASEEQGGANCWSTELSGDDDVSQEELLAMVSAKAS
jgi:hypothetical protein